MDSDWFTVFMWVGMMILDFWEERKSKALLKFDYNLPGENLMDLVLFYLVFNRS